MGNPVKPKAAPLAASILKDLQSVKPYEAKDVAKAIKSLNAGK